MTEDDIEGCRAAHRSLMDRLAGLTDDQARRPSRLPRWSVGHVLTHLARNADSHVRMLAAARGGEVADQYAGGPRQRAADIEAGAGRPAAELLADVAASCAALEEAWAQTPAATWADGRGRTAVEGEVPVRDVPFRRWREVEVHHADLGLGYGWEQWPDAYVDQELARALAGLPERLAPGQALRLEATDTAQVWELLFRAPGTGGAEEAMQVALPRRELLAWLLGRHDAPSLPAIAAWQPDQRGDDRPGH